MNRREELEMFFEFLKQVAIQNSNQDIKHTDIYSMLRLYAVKDYTDPNELASYESLFIKWQERYQNVQNMNCYHDDRQSLFLQFHNKSVYNDKFVKLYVSPRPEAMEESVNRIFDFAAVNDIEMMSKVAIVDGSDSVVLRIHDEQKAINMIDYINSDPYLVQNARVTNPFLTRFGIVGAAYDDLLSYNTTVSIIVADYIQKHKQNNSLDNINLNNFNAYLNNMYEDTFQNGSNFIDFINNVKVNDHLNDSTRWKTKGDVMVNYMHVINCMRENIKATENASEFFSAYELSKNEEYNQKESAKFNNTFYELDPTPLIR